MKINLKSISVLVALIGLASSFARAEDANTFNLRTAELGATLTLQSQGGSSYSSIARWLPEYQLTSQYRVGVDLGFTIIKLKDTLRLPVFETAAFGAYQINQCIDTRLLIGAETITGGSYGTAFMAGAIVDYSFSEPVLNYIHGAFFSYNVSFYNLALHQLALGLQFKF